MNELDLRACGIDLRHDSVFACARIPRPNGCPELVHAVFGSSPSDLLSFRNWLWKRGVTHLALSPSAGSSQVLVRLLEDYFSIVRVDAAPGEPASGHSLAAELAEELGRSLEGNVSASPILFRELDHLRLFRKNIDLERRRGLHRLHRVLKDGGIRISRVTQSISGTSVRAILDKLIQGERDPFALAQLARGRLRTRMPELEQSLRGSFRDHHRFLAAEMLAHIDYLEELGDRVTDRLERLERKVSALVRPREEAAAERDLVHSR